MTPEETIRRMIEEDIRKDKPKRVREIEEATPLLFPCQKLGEGVITESEEWTTWACPLPDGGMTLVQYYHSASFNKSRVEEMVFSLEEVELFSKLVKIREVMRTGFKGSYSPP